jgi:hypothetical protein
MGTIACDISTIIVPVLRAQPFGEPRSKDPVMSLEAVNQRAPESETKFRPPRAPDPSVDLPGRLRMSGTIVERRNMSTSEAVAKTLNTNCPS